MKIDRRVTLFVHRGRFFVFSRGEKRQMMGDCIDVLLKIRVKRADFKPANKIAENVVERKKRMGCYFNLGNASFQSMRKGLYVDKSKLIDHINDTLGTEDKLTCVTRPRRFGKSYAAQMLCAYYDKSCDSRLLFENLAITKSKNFTIYLNKYPVIYLDMVWFISTVKEIREIVRYVQREAIRELRET